MDTVADLLVKAIDDEKRSLNDLSQNIWHLKELGLQEKQSHAVLCEFLESRGFVVQRSAGGLETAFVGSWETKDEEGDDSVKPHIAVLCEYDALPEIGHACGHNLIAEIGVAAAIGIKAALQKGNGLRGKLSVVGSPAEESGGGKIDLINSGTFSGVHAALMAHPAPFSDARPTFLSTKRMCATFEGRPSHAAGFPWEGVNALDAAVQAYVSIGTFRQQMKPDWRVGVIISKGGVRTNIIPSEAELKVQIRTSKESEIHDLERKIKRCISAAADATGCKLDISDGPRSYKSLVTNQTLANLYESSLADLGAEVPCPKIKQILGSTDMGNVSHETPSLHPTYNCNTTAFNHTVEFAKAAASEEAQLPTLIQAKALAMTALKVYTNPKLLESIQNEFKKDMEEY